MLAGTEVDDVEVVTHLVGFVAHVLMVAKSELAKRVGSPAFEVVGLEHGTRVDVAAGDGNSGPTGAEVDQRQRVSHLARIVANVVGVAIPKLTVGIISPTFDTARVEYHTGVFPVGRDGDDAPTGAEVDQRQRVAHLARIVANAFIVACSVITDLMSSPARDLVRLCEHHARVSRAGVDQPYGPSGADVDVRQVVSHLLGDPSVPFVAIAETTIVALAPTFDAERAEESAIVIPADAELDDGFRAAEIDKRQSIAHLTFFVANCFPAAVAELPQIANSKAFDLTHLQQDTRVRVASTDSGDRLTGTEVDKCLVARKANRLGVSIAEPAFSSPADLISTGPEVSGTLVAPTLDAPRRLDQGTREAVASGDGDGGLLSAEVGERQVVSRLPRGVAPVANASTGVRRHRLAVAVALAAGRGDLSDLPAMVVSPALHAHPVEHRARVCRSGRNLGAHAGAHAGAMASGRRGRRGLRGGRGWRERGYRRRERERRMRRSVAAAVARTARGRGTGRGIGRGTGANFGAPMREARIVRAAVVEGVDEAGVVQAFVKRHPTAPQVNVGEAHSRRKLELPRVAGTGLLDGSARDLELLHQFVSVEGHVSPGVELRE